MAEALLSLVGSEERYAESTEGRLAADDRFAELIAALASHDNVAALAGWAATEAAVYADEGIVTYRTSRFLLDVFSDTSERSPTFALPPLRPHGDSAQPAPWVTVQDPARSSRDAWTAMLRRPPRGLTWNGATMVDCALRSRWCGIRRGSTTAR